MTSRNTGRSTQRSHALGTVVVLGSLVAGGCVSSDPYWSREDRNSAESIEAAEAAARAARQQAQPAAASEQSPAPETRPATVESEPLASPPPQPYAPPPEGITEESPESPEGRAAEATASAGSGIEQSDLELEEPQEEPGSQPSPDTDLAGAADPSTADLSTADLSTGHYEASLELLQEGRLPEAEEGFRRYLAENPDSDLADNAQFWLAESALRRSDPAAALAGFRAVVENYPEANKVPDALLKVGYCLGELGELESAATVYRELIVRFPESAAAETARLRLAAP